MKQLKIRTKFIISILYDIGDFTIGRIPGFGTGYDILGAALGYYLWGNYGLAQGWELLDVTDQLDGFIPTLTIVGLLKQSKVLK